MRRHLVRAALAAALSLAAFTAAAGCTVNRASGEKTCVYSGKEMGWAAGLQFITVAGEPFLIVGSSADGGRITPDAVLFREKDGAPVRMPVHASTQASNCMLGSILFGTCMPTTTAVVKLDRATMVELAGRKATYVAAAAGPITGPSVKLKGSQMRHWLALYDAARSRDVSAPVAHAAQPAPPSPMPRADGARIAAQAATGGRHDGGLQTMSTPNPNPGAPGQTPNPTNPAERNDPVRTPDQNPADPANPRPTNPQEADDDAPATR